MLNKCSSTAAISVLLLSTNSYSSDFDENFQYEQQLNKTMWDRLIDLGSSWVRRQGQSSTNSDNVIYGGQAPTLAQWRSGTQNWEPAACLNSDASNSGVWINNVKEKHSKTGGFASYDNLPLKSASYKRYIISANTPYELESKNFKRAGIKRFADYHYSYRIDHEQRWQASSTVIDNKKSHDYHAIHTFNSGTSWVHSTTFSDFEWSIGVKNNTGDINYPESWGNASNYSVRGSWGGDIYLSDCGFAEVISEPNTKPVINSFSAIQSSVELDDHFEIHYYTRLRLNATDIDDYHTSDSNLTYTWSIVHESGKKSTTYGKSTTFGIGDVIPQIGVFPDRATKVTLIVSDGDMSTVAIQNL